MVTIYIPQECFLANVLRSPNNNKCVQQDFNGLNLLVDRLNLFEQENVSLTLWLECVDAPPR